MLAAERVLNGHFKNAFVPAGGMHHHAMSDRASGFGIFNDAVIAIKHHHRPRPPRSSTSTSTSTTATASNPGYTTPTER